MTDLSAWTPRPRPERHILEGRYVRLEPLDPARHGDALFAAGAAPGEEARFRYLFERPLVRRADFDAWLDKAVSTADPLFFAVIDEASGRAEGRLSFMRIDATHGVIETGSILFGPDLARTRAATEAIYLQAKHAFEDLGYRRFEWKCHNDNEPSKRAARRFGFTFEGIFRQHMVVKGENRDTAWFAMLDRDWPQRKAAFERWLDPANFDADGRQHLRLADLNATELEAEGVRPRRAGTADLAALTALQRASYAPNRDLIGAEPIPLKADYADILRHYEVWLAEGEAELSGALILDPQPGHLLVWSVSVAPDAQGRGLGNALLGAAEARARALGLDTVRLYTGEQLSRNRAWYARRGYAVERIERLDDRTLVHMIKTVSQT